MTLYDRIRQLRIEKGWSQSDLAKKVGYKDKTAIAHIEKGERDISRSKIAAFASALGVSPTYLLDGKENSPTELSEGERELLELFRSLPEDKQRLALEMIKAALSATE